MPRRRPRRALVVVLALLAVLAAGAALTATGRLPFLVHAWGTLPFASSAEASAGASASAAPLPDDAGASKGEAGATPRPQTAPLSSAQLGAPLVHGTFVTACGAPDDMKVVVKVDVKMGHAVKVDVKTDPPDPAVAACIDKATRDLRWDPSTKTGHVTVRY
jgi:hypothetical protein